MDMFNEQITKIINKFDFEKVQKAMSQNNWKWAVASKNGDMRVPGIIQLVHTATVLLYQAVEVKGDCSTGGLIAQYIETPEEEMEPYSLPYSLKLMFVLEECEE